MSASDFDDIFGDDVKMDATAAPTLTNVSLDDDELFGGDPSGKVTKPAEVSGDRPPQGQSNWEKIGSNEQDEFMSWLDGENTSQAAPTTEASIHETSAPIFDVSPPPAPVAPVPANTFESVSLDDDNDDFDNTLESGSTEPSSSVSAPAAAVNGISLDDNDGFDQMLDSANAQPGSFESPPVATADSVSPNDDDDLDRMLQATMPASARIHSFRQPSMGNISLDDDDDDDLEQIVEKANQQNKQANASGSRENSNSSLQIKSQVQAQQKTQIDVTAARQAFLETGELPGGSRLAVWQRAVQVRRKVKRLCIPADFLHDCYRSSPGAADSASMYAVQTTSRSLPSQALLRKEVEALCSRIFSSAAHARILQEVGDSMRGTHLLFIDSAETLFTYLCTQLDIDYFSGMVLTFAPLLLASGSEPLHPETVETLAATCRRFLPHIGKKLPIRSSTTDRRPLLKRMLLYHAPRLAAHLNEHFPTWNHAPPEEYDGTKGSGAIPDSWLASFFEGDAIVSDPANFDFLLKVWDCSLLLEAFSSAESAPLTTGCFITLYSIVTAEKALRRMEGEQLRHCMAATLTETLLRGEATKNHVFVRGVRDLMNATPPCFCATLRSSGVPPPPIVENDAAKSADTQAPAVPNSTFGMNTLLSASTQGLKDVSNLMIDMPVKLMIDMPGKLLTMVPLNPMAALSSPTSNSLTDSPETQQLFYLHVQAMEVAAVSMTLEAREVMPSMFGGIQGHDVPAATSLRYFVVDCRGSEDMRGGVHICVMGHGYAHIAEELRQFQQKQGVASASPFSLSEHFLETYANDQSRVQSTIEFLLKHEFPRVSVLEGGYSAAHGHLFRSHSLTVDDLADHDTPNCKLCQHDRSMRSVHPPASGGALSVEEKKEAVNQDDSNFTANARTASSRTSESSQRSSAALDEAGFTDISLSSANAVNSKSPAAGSYYSSFAGAFKSGSKTLLSPTMDGTKWLLKKSAATTAEFANAAASMGNMGSKNRTGSMQGAAAIGKTPGAPPSKDTKPAMPNLNKLRNSLVAIGSESLDMLKKVESAMEHAVEQAAVATTTTTAKVRVPFPSTISPSSKDAGSTATSAASKSPSTATSTATTPPAPRGALSSDPAHSKFFHQSTDEMFTIDDDDDDEDHEGHFVHDFDGGESRASATSSFARDFSCRRQWCYWRCSRRFQGPIHSSRATRRKRRQELPSRVTSTHPRRVLVMENNLVVLKSATRNEDDVFIVKSCHPLSHITRMTCLKKNALMVSIYYKWKADDGQIVERRNSYEVQQRDDFIKAVKTTMDKM
ncbi:hypothetical protein PRIC2_009113 [Phytophthora ramorum]